MRSHGLAIVFASLVMLIEFGDGSANAAFIRADGDSWKAISNDSDIPADDVSRSVLPTEPEASPFELLAVVTQRVEFSIPGSRTSSPVKRIGQSAPVASTIGPVRAMGIQYSYRLWLEGQPRLPPPMSAMILDPPRSAVGV